MLPVLFTIGPYNVYAFGAFLSLSFLLSTFIVWRYAKEEFREEAYMDVFLFSSIGSLVFARITYIILHFPDFGWNMLRFIMYRLSPGLSLIGGLVSGTLFVYWYAKRKKLDAVHVFDIFSIAASFAIACAKIGEQLGGAAYGRETSAVISVQIVGLPGRFHPAELYEAVAFLLFGIMLSFLYGLSRRKKWPKGTIACTFAAGAFLLIFGLEFFKAYPVYLYGLSARQLSACIGLVFVMMPLGIRIRAIFARRRKYEISKGHA